MQSGIVLGVTGSFTGVDSSGRFKQVGRQAGGWVAWAGMWGGWRGWAGGAGGLVGRADVGSQQSAGRLGGG